MRVMRGVGTRKAAQGCVRGALCVGRPCVLSFDVFADEGLEARPEGTWARWFQHGQAACTPFRGCCHEVSHTAWPGPQNISVSHCWRPEAKIGEGRAGSSEGFEGNPLP